MSSSQTAEALKYQAKQYFLKGSYIEALAKYQQAVQKEQNQEKLAILHTNIGLCYFNLNLIESYRKSIKQALESNPKYSKAQWHLIETNIEDSQRKILIELIRKKKISFQKGFQASHNWLQAFKRKNLQFGYQSKELSIEKSKYGLGIKAKKDIPAWKIILVQRPMVFTDSEEEKYSDAQAMCTKIQKLMKLSQQFRAKFLGVCNDSILQLDLQSRKKRKNPNPAQIEQAVRRNWFAVEQLYDNLSGKEKCSIGSGLYEKISFLNHQCERNCQYFFIGQWMIVRTVFPIKKGEQVFITYHYQKQLHERRRQIAKWGIKCDCIYCHEQEQQEKGHIDPRQIDQLKSKQFQRQMISTEKFHQFYEKLLIPKIQACILSTPETRWSFMLNFHRQSKIKGKLLAMMFKCPQLGAKFQEMFKKDEKEAEQDPQMQMLRNMGDMFKMQGIGGFGGNMQGFPGLK